MKYKISLLFIILFVLPVARSFGFDLYEPIGGVATSLGGVVLDRDLQGLNILYNPTMIAMNYTGRSELNVAVSYARSPYSVQGFDNSSVGITYAHGFGDFAMGYGLGVQMNLVDAGLSTYKMYAAGSCYYTGLKKLAGWLSFLDGVGASVNINPMMYNVPDYMSEIDGFSNNPMGVDLNADITLSLFENKLSVGFLAANILETEVTFYTYAVSLENSVKCAEIVHLKINPIKNLTIFAAVNVNGDKHLINIDNFFGSSTLLANTYFGLEGNFSESLFVRIGVNEGQLSGGIGLDVADLTINLGIQSIYGLHMYYQLDLNYRFGNLSGGSANDLDGSIEQ